MKLREAFRRRALAMDLAQMVSYTVSEEWHAFLFLSIQRDPPKRFQISDTGSGHCGRQEAPGFGV